MYICIIKVSFSHEIKTFERLIFKHINGLSYMNTLQLEKKRGSVEMDVNKDVLMKIFRRSISSITS